jgi:5-methylcytosine-specific restriction endonuclease McrBC GTP-binding regulatory subunit McrB
MNRLVELANQTIYLPYKDFVMPSEHAQQLEVLWKEFRQRWPLQKLREMTLVEYNTHGDEESFCYWLEAKVEELGSIWGGSAFKFGVYSRKDKTSREDGAGRCYNDQYGWMKKYGDTPQQAFEAVRAEIVKVAEAASAGNLQAVQKANLGEAIRWKLAFLYQDPENPQVIPVYKLSVLRALLDNKKINAADAHRLLVKKAAGRNIQGAEIFDYAGPLWVQGVEALESSGLTLDETRDYLDGLSDFKIVAASSANLVGYWTQCELPIGLLLQSQKVQLVLKAGDWQTKIQKSTLKLKLSFSLPAELEADAVATELHLNDEKLVLATLSSMSELEALCRVYEDPEADVSDVERPSSSLNQILYGPPGTGKTYATTELAVQIADPDSYKILSRGQSALEIRTGIKARYDELVSRGRIEFATFHQSFSYEDFIEGIRAETAKDGSGLEYKVKDGIFKSIADLASKTVGGQNRLGLSESPTIWKISIGRRDESEMRNRYLDAGEARIGWNDTGDLSVPLDERSDEEQRYWDSLSVRNHAALEDFSEKMKQGDVLLCFKDQFTIRAIGIVTSEYRFDSVATHTDEREYAHVRNVNWLIKGISLDMRNLNGSKRMVQQTLYELGRVNWKSLLAEVERQGIRLPGVGESETSKPSPNHVIIIDEINRGNIARIFGELITLLEPDKRKGGIDERTVVLPYSKESFTVPSNLYVIGTMNTADKSLAQLDLALRRRFEFVEVMPKPELLEGVMVHGVSMQDLLQTINDRIEVLLDRDHLIGHSYFLSLKRVEDTSERAELLAGIFENRVIPLLQEYFFADWEKIGWVLNDDSKPEEFRFVQMLGSKGNLNQLFSSEVAAGLVDRRYRINSAAFSKPEAYKGIFLGNHD